MNSLTRTISRGALFASVLLPLLGAWGAARNSGTGDQAKGSPAALATGGITHGKSNSGLAAFLVTTGEPFKKGGPVSLSYGIICKASEPEHPDVPKSLKVVRPYPAVNPNNHSWFSVTGPDGRELEYRDPFVSFPRAPPDQVLVLWTGEFVGRTSSDLPFNFDFNKPGRYRVRWNYLPDTPEGLEGVWAGELVSNTVEIEIGP
jgi:hypothetical protein